MNIIRKLTVFYPDRDSRNSEREQRYVVGNDAYGGKVIHSIIKNEGFYEIIIRDPKNNETMHWKDVDIRHKIDTEYSLNFE